jgi:uncharacterized protein YjdB
MRYVRLAVLAALVAAGAACESIYDRDVTVVVTGPTTVQVGETVLLNARLEYSKGLPEIVGPSTAALVSWSSSNTTIATVDFFGFVTGVAPGSVTITATPASGITDGKRTAGTHAMTVE